MTGGIKVGLTGWGDHNELYEGIANRDKLKIYSDHFPIVEVDSSFYAMQPAKNYLKWIEETPQDFSFIIKAYQGMTGHLRGKNPFASEDEMFGVFIDSIQPVIAAGKLKAVLFQYPPWFECRREEVDKLRYAKKRFGDIPAALEFRHQSWFAPEMRDRTLSFMEEEGWIHSICDEPQAGEGSVPAVLHPTHSELTIVRFHGRNLAGWNQNGQPNWREVRYLYRYSLEELQEWKEKIGEIQKQTKEICLVFNNNSGGDAAANGKQMMELLGLKYGGNVPRQIGFDF